MLKKGQKYLLQNLFAIRDRQPETREITKQRIPKLIKKRDHFGLQPFPAVTRPSGHCASQSRERGSVCGTGRHALPLYWIFRFPPSCSKFLCDKLQVSMIHEILPVGILQCNCSIFGDEQRREAVVIDPGDEINIILTTLAKHHLRVKAIIITHAHIDHRSEEHTSELQSLRHLVCRLLLE